MFKAKGINKNNVHIVGEHHPTKGETLERKSSKIP